MFSSSSIKNFSMLRINLYTEHFAIDSNLQDFVKIQKAHGFQCEILNPIPNLIEQSGYNCGYYALSICTDFWHKKNNQFKFFPARQGDVSLRSIETTSLRSLRSKIKVKTNLTKIGGIADVGNFSVIMSGTGYDTHIIPFTCLFELSELIKCAIDKNFPAIFPVDFSLEQPVLTGGTNAHYVTIVGYIKTQNQILGCLYSTYGKYFYSPLPLLFDSCNNLLVLPSANYLKEDDWKEVPQCTGETVSTETTSLDKLRNKLIIVFPFQYANAYQNLLTMAYANIQNKKSENQFVIEMIRKLLKNELCELFSFGSVTTIRFNGPIQDRQMLDYAHLLSALGLPVKIIKYESMFKNDELDIGVSFDEVRNKLITLMQADLNFSEVNRLKAGF